MVYRDGEPQVHKQHCKDLVHEAYVDEFTAESLDLAKIIAADIYAEDLDCFDGRYDTVEDAREESMDVVRVMPCLTRVTYTEPLGIRIGHLEF